MSKDSTLIVLVLDRSGSMLPIAEQTIKMVNDFIDEQKKLPGEAFFTLVQFDHEFEELYSGSLQHAAKLTPVSYVPRGTTALLDAIGRTIDIVGKRLASMSETERPGKVVFAIMTDGYENASHDYTHAKIKEMTEHQQKKYSWIFHYLGANQDAIQVAGTIGIPMAHALTYQSTARGMGTAGMSFSNSVGNTRKGLADHYTLEDRQKNSTDE